MKGIDILTEVLQERIEEKRRGVVSKTNHVEVLYCPKCETSKPADTEHFYKDSKSKTGLSCWCKGCQRASSAKSWKKKQDAKKAVKASKAGSKTKSKSKPKPFDIRDPEPSDVRDQGDVSGQDNRRDLCGITDQKDMTLVLDFSSNQMLFADIEVEACEQMRTPEMQAMWLISIALNHKSIAQVVCPHSGDSKS